MARATSAGQLARADAALRRLEVAIQRRDELGYQDAVAGLSKLAAQLSPAR